MTIDDEGTGEGLHAGILRQIQRRDVLLCRPQTLFELIDLRLCSDIGFVRLGEGRETVFVLSFGFPHDCGQRQS